MRREIDVKEDLLPPESLTPERRLSRVYETLYIVFSYIGQDEGVEEGVQGLHVRIVGDSGYSVARCVLRIDGPCHDFPLGF